MRVTGKESIFDTIAQDLIVDARAIEPLVDRVLIEDIPEEGRRGSLYIPDSANNKELIRQGRVVAVGPGDKWTEHGLDATGGVRRRSMAGRSEMPVKVGDLVLYSRRKDLEVYIGGVRHSLVNVEQSVFAVLEG